VSWLQIVVNWKCNLPKERIFKKLD